MEVFHGRKDVLKWYNKIGYGSGDIAGNVVYAFLTSFVMVYLTDTIGLASGIVGTLIAASKLFDGFTDVFFGSLIDKTHTKLGKGTIQIYQSGVLRIEILSKSNEFDS